MWAPGLLARDLMKEDALQLATGQVVVHPQHGPGTVTGFTTRAIRGTSTRYARLEVHHSDLMVGIPLDRSAQLGIRAPICGAEVGKLFSVLAGPSEPFERVWSRRIKATWDKVLSGDPFAAAGAVRDLTRRQHSQGVSPGERTLLRDARTPLINELEICLGVSNEEAEKALDQAILDHIIPAQVQSAD